MKIFISSTVYDLIDLRGELYQDLSSLGMTPVMSDVKSAGFKIEQNKSSIETCLANVRNSAYLLLILSNRYGATLEEYGYDKISATHLEYREAIKNKIPTFVYIRDRLWGDYEVWRRNKREITLPWIQEKEYGLFELIEERRKLEETNKNNWCTTFTDSMDLKAIIRKDLKAPIREFNFITLLRNNEVPIITGELNQSYNQQTRTITLTLVFTNYGKVPAFDFIVRCKDMNFDNTIPIIAPSQHVNSSMLIPAIKGRKETHIINTTYKDSFGNEYVDDFLMESEIAFGLSKALVVHKKRTYMIGGSEPFTIDKGHRE